LLTTPTSNTAETAVPTATQPLPEVAAIAPPETISRPETQTGAADSTSAPVAQPPQFLETPFSETSELDLNQTAPVVSSNAAEILSTATPLTAPAVLADTQMPAPSIPANAVAVEVVVPPDPTRTPLEPVPETSNPAQPLDPDDVADELGEVRILRRPPQQPPPPRQPNVQLLLRSSAFTSSNISATTGFQPSDTIFFNGATLLATPKLGPDTRLIASAGVGLVRFVNQGDFNYNLLNFDLGIQQRLAPGTYGQLGWTEERLYRDGSGDRLLRDDSIRLILGRQDQIAKQLRLDSFYELRASFSDPTDQSRVANTLGARLRYDITPQFHGALDYRLSFKNFTEVNRSDTEQQVSALAIYNINPNLFIGGSVSYLFGTSSNPLVDLPNFSVGVNVGLNIPLF
jgi:hypothetical protein